MAQRKSERKKLIGTVNRKWLFEFFFIPSSWQLFLSSQLVDLQVSIDVNVVKLARLLFQLNLKPKVK